MPVRNVARRLSLAAMATLVLAGLAACGSGMSIVQTRTQGYDISEDALAQVRPGQSADLVRVVLGSPQTTNTFGNETAWYYIQTKVRQTSFGMTMVQDRTVLAIYLDGNNRVSRKMVYGLQDGRVVDFETRRTPSFGEDRTFIEQILGSVTGG